MVVDEELAVVQGTTELSQERELSGRGEAVFRRVQLLSAATTFGRVHRQVGTLDERADVVAVFGIERNPDARLDLEREPFEQGWKAYRLSGLLGDLDGGGGVPNVSEHDAELVSSETSDRVCIAEHCAQTTCDLLQQEVAPLVSERVVDLLEAVEIDDEDRGAGGLAPRTSDSLFRPVTE